MAGTPIDPSYQFINVTPSDTDVLMYHNHPVRTKGIAFKTAGALAIKDDQGTTVVIPSGVLVAGVIHPISTDKILSTGTTAVDIAAFF